MEASIRALYPPSRRRRQPPARRSSSSSSSSLSPSPSCRFTELLLEHGERHVEDWAVVASSSPPGGGPGPGGGGDAAGGGAAEEPTRRMASVEGRLRLCTKSVVFEPNHASRGMVRVPFGDAAGPPVLVADGSAGPGCCRGTVEVAARRHAVIRENDVVGPYRHVGEATEFRFAFRFSSPGPMVEACGRLMRGTRGGGRQDGGAAPFAGDLDGAPPTIPLPTSDGPDFGDAPPGPSPTEPPRFDVANFETVGERPLSPTLSCSVRTPLLEDRGVAVLTDRALYYQPTSRGLGAAGGTPPRVRGRATAWPHGTLVGVARRYDGLRDTGLEVYAPGGSALLSFESPAAREAVLRLILERTSCRPVPLPVYTDRSYVEQASELWHAGRIDNYEYLLVLNCAAGRSFMDLSRYPVMPWVLSEYGPGPSGDDGRDAANKDGEAARIKIDLDDERNYRDLSRPMGALNEERYRGFEARYESLAQSQGKDGARGNPLDAPFLYGTHYSAPGYVLFYLLRTMPQHMLCLQNGRFDVPDRLFHSVGSTYRSALENPADVKELIPEMFDPDCSDFLINSGGLRLGSLQTGERVDDVLLPPWARGARHFVRTNRRALESDACTRRLHLWIDLVFGSRSRGARARDAGNLFHPIAYLGPADLAGLPGGDRGQAELQSAEFGIVPDALFCRDHPPRGSAPPDGGRATLTRDELRDSYAAGGRGGFSRRSADGAGGPSSAGRAMPSVPRADDVIAESMNLLESTDVAANPFDD